MRHRYHAIIAFAIYLIATPMAAHELWIQPIQRDLKPGDTLEATVRVGENLRGGAQIYNPDSYQNLLYLVGDTLGKVEGTLGDRPAISIPKVQDGLHLVVLESSANRLTYNTFEKFAGFVTRHDQSFAIDAHRARGLPEEKFRESYFRFAKSLIKVGSGTGQDRLAGMPLELTALDNPYTDDGPVRFQLTYKKQAVADFQIDVFHRPFGSVKDAELSFLRTDANGIVTVPRQQGDFLISAVKLEEPSARIAEATDSVWISLWASSTYWIE